MVGPRDELLLLLPIQSSQEPTVGTPGLSETVCLSVGLAVPNDEWESNEETPAENNRILDPWCQLRNQPV